MLFPSHNLSSSKQTERIKARRCIFTVSREHCLHVENASLFNIVAEGLLNTLDATIHNTVGHINKYIKNSGIIVQFGCELFVCLFYFIFFFSVGMGTKSNFKLLLL